MGKEIIKFEGNNCGACRAMEPAWKRFKEKNVGLGIEFKNINVTEHMELTSQFEIQAIPTFISLEEGEEVERIVGIIPENSLQKLINSLI